MSIVPSLHLPQISSAVGTARGVVVSPATAGSGVVWCRASCPGAARSGARSSGNQLFRRSQTSDLQQTQDPISFLILIPNTGGWILK